MPGFGSCCDDLREALSIPEGRTLNVDDDGVLVLTVAAVDTDEGPAFFDFTVGYCPFCGTKIEAPKPGASEMN